MGVYINLKQTVHHSRSPNLKQNSQNQRAILIRARQLLPELFDFLEYDTIQLHILQTMIKLGPTTTIESIAHHTHTDGQN